LAEHGIVITGKVPKRLPILQYPNFPNDSPSLLKKYLSESLWKELRSLKTEKDGRLANCIVAGIENPKLGVGIYACDEHAYKQFSKFFEPVIKELHDYDIKSGALVKHNYALSNIEWSKIDKTKNCFKFIQVIASRNIRGYSFVPNLDPIARAEIEELVNKRITSEIDVKVEISKLAEDDKKKLANEGLLFDRHPSIESIVPEAKCKEKCFIYYNNDLSQVIWINAEDHVQYFITQKVNPDLKQVCEKLFRRVNGLELDLPLCLDQNLGYITCNPEYLGTSLRMKVIVELYRASEKQVKFELLSNFCRQYSIGVKHVGENMYEFVQSKTLQLGKTEADIVEGLFLCINEVLHFEHEAILMEEGQAKKQQAETSAHTLKNMPQFDEMNTSLIRPFINADVWIKLGEEMTLFNHTLRQCIKPGLENHKIGIIALDADCYEKFKDLFMYIIQIYHERYKPINFPLYNIELSRISDLLKNAQFITNGYFLWQGNLKNMPFPAGLNKKTREECNSRLFSLLTSMVNQYSMKVGGIEEIENMYYNDIAIEKNKIKELSMNWPDQRLVCYSDKRKVIFMTNIMNHLAIAMPITGREFLGNITEFFDVLDVLVTKQMSLWAFSETFGFQETLPTDIGNAFTFKIAVKIPGVKEITSYLPLAESKGVLLTKMEDFIHLSHKHKFKTALQCIIDTLEVFNEIIKAEKVQPIEETKEIVNEFFTEELFKKYKGASTSKGITIELIKSKSDINSSNPIPIEGIDSFNEFYELYANALKKLSNGSFNLDTFRYDRTELVLAPLDLPALPTTIIGKTVELSRNIDDIAFPAFMNNEDRNKVAKQCKDLFVTFEVRYRVNCIGEECW